MDTDYVLTELQRGRGKQFDPEALDAFMRLIEKGVIDLNALYAQKSAEIAGQAASSALSKRVEEDKRIQAGEASATDAGKGASA